MRSAQWNFDIMQSLLPQNSLVPSLRDKSSWLDRGIIVKYFTAGAVCWQQSLRLKSIYIWPYL